MHIYFKRLLVVFIIALLSLSQAVIPSGFVHAETTAERETRLNAELDATEKEIAQWQTILDSKKQETASLSRDQDILNAQIAEEKLKIKAHNLSIERLGKDIGIKTQTISDLEDKIQKGQESLAQLLRKTREIDSFSTVETMLSNQNLSQFFIDLDSFDSINRALKESFTEIRQVKAATETAKDELGKKKDQETDITVSIEAEKRAVEKQEAEKKTLLAISKSQEQVYSSVLKDRQQKAAEIRSALFALRDTAAIPFGDALMFATTAFSKTNVRPAFLLAILTQESNLGQNTGSCYLTNKDTGEGVGVKTGTLVSKVMKPDRDVGPFIQITADVGRDPYKTLVSCPQSIGWGGAMGPGQFIPSTWDLIKDSVASAVGATVADPWRPKDAIMASAIYLQGLGAGDGGYSAERNAACRYYSGKVCSKSTYATTYGNQVMAKVQNIQENMIDPLQNL